MELLLRTCDIAPETERQDGNISTAINVVLCLSDADAAWTVTNQEPVGTDLLRINTDVAADDMLLVEKNISEYWRLRGGIPTIDGDINVG